MNHSPFKRRALTFLGGIGIVGALALAACGGGSTGGTGAGTSATSGAAGTVNGATAGALSSGAITAFGSIFVNGHEYATGSALVIDDDTGASTSSTAGLEVGMAVDVAAAPGSTASAPVASTVHLHPLARGYVDTLAAGGGSLTVMGQSVALTASTIYSDHRSCLSASVSPCMAITAASGLSATTGSAGSAVAGSYVTVHGYLYASGVSSAGASIVATLVQVQDPPTGSGAVNFKAEGVVTASSGTSITVGSLVIDLSSATCRIAAATTACASAFSVGQVVSAFGATAPPLPASTFTAGSAVLRNRLPVQTAGQTVELQGKVFGVSTAAQTFVLRGVTVDASALSGGSLPAVGDDVIVLGTVSSSGTSITASAVQVLHAAVSASYGFEGDATAVTPGAAADTFVLSLLGESITVNALTRLCDRSMTGNVPARLSATNPVTITTFQSYLAASSSQHLIVNTQSDASGNLSAVSVTIVPTSTEAAVTGTVDSTPAPVDSSASGVPFTFSVHALPVSALPASLVFRRSAAAPVSAASGVSAGDLVLARGTYAAPTLSVTGAASGPAVWLSHVVVDFGQPSSPDQDAF